MNIEVAFALAERQELIGLEVPSGTTVEMAIDQSGIAALFPEQDLSACQTGIWGKPVPRDRLLKDGDRVELYRPLKIDPREARRKLAALGQSMGKAADEPPKDSD